MAFHPAHSEPRHQDIDPSLFGVAAQPLELADDTALLDSEEHPSPRVDVPVRIVTPSDKPNNPRETLQGHPGAPGAAIRIEDVQRELQEEADRKAFFAERNEEIKAQNKERQQDREVIESLAEFRKHEDQQERRRQFHAEETMELPAVSPEEARRFHERQTKELPVVTTETTSLSAQRELLSLQAELSEAEQDVRGSMNFFRRTFTKVKDKSDPRARVRDLELKIKALQDELDEPAGLLQTIRSKPKTAAGIGLAGAAAGALTAYGARDQIAHYSTTTPETSRTEASGEAPQTQVPEQQPEATGPLPLPDSYSVPATFPTVEQTQTPARDIDLSPPEQSPEDAEQESDGRDVAYAVKKGDHFFRIVRKLMKKMTPEEAAAVIKQYRDKNPDAANLSESRIRREIRLQLARDTGHTSSKDGFSHPVRFLVNDMVQMNISSDGSLSLDLSGVKTFKKPRIKKHLSPAEIQKRRETRKNATRDAKRRRNRGRRGKKDKKGDGGKRNDYVSTTNDKQRDALLARTAHTRLASGRPVSTPAPVERGVGDLEGQAIPQREDVSRSSIDPLTEELPNIRRAALNGTVESATLAEAAGKIFQRITRAARTINKEKGRGNSQKWGPEIRGGEDEFGNNFPVSPEYIRWTTLTAAVKMTEEARSQNEGDPPGGDEDMAAWVREHVAIRLEDSDIEEVANN